MSLKESLDTYEAEQQQCYRVKEFKALLTRLECAEKVCDEMTAMFLPPHSYSIEPLKAWLKSKGDAGR